MPKLEELNFGISLEQLEEANQLEAKLEKVIEAAFELEKAGHSNWPLVHLQSARLVGGSTEYGNHVIGANEMVLSLALGSLREKGVGVVLLNEAPLEITEGTNTRKVSYINLFRPGRETDPDFSGVTILKQAIYDADDTPVSYLLHAIPTPLALPVMDRQEIA